MQKGRAADAERAAAQQEAAVAAAIEKVRAEIEPLSTDAAKHMDELRALEERLIAKHRQELEAAVAAARKESSNPDIGAAVAAAVAQHEKEAQARLEQEISAAIERGRIEQSTKGKLKDQALVRVQHKLKELENQVTEWRKAGLIPGPPGPTAGPSTPIATVTTPTPRKASVDNLATATNPSSPMTPTEAVGRGRGRGSGRGRGAVARGAAPPVSGVALAVPPGLGAGVSILGAATKRVHDGDTPDDALSKRLKPGEGNSKPPITIRRDRVAPPAQ